jgi:hypothetical protein
MSDLEKSGNFKKIQSSDPQSDKTRIFKLKFHLIFGLNDVERCKGFCN